MSVELQGIHNQNKKDHDLKLSEAGSFRASKTLYACCAIATITAMVISLAYPAWVLSHLSASPFNTTTDSNSALGIHLDLSVDSTSLQSGNAIRIMISEHNVRFSTNEVRAASNWKAPRLSLGPCGTLNQPIGFAIMKGNYTKANLLTGHPLQLYQPGTYLCPVILFGISSYIFDSVSDNASIMGPCSGSPCFKLTVESESVVAGSWEDTIPFVGPQSYHMFSPGVYTVVGGDEWGDLTVLNFTVF